MEHVWEHQLTDAPISTVSILYLHGLWLSAVLSFGSQSFQPLIPVDGKVSP